MFWCWRDPSVFALHQTTRFSSSFHSAGALLPSSSSCQGLLPVPCPCHPSASPTSSMAVQLILPKLQALPLFLLNSVLASLDLSSSSLGAFGILIPLSNVSGDPLRLLTDGDLITVPSTPSSSLLRNGLERQSSAGPCIPCGLGFTADPWKPEGNSGQFFPA